MGAGTPAVLSGVADARTMATIEEGERMEATTHQSKMALNSRTCCLDLSSAAAAAARRLGPRESFLIAHERLALLAAVAKQPSFAVAAVGPDARVVEALLIADRRSLVIGRHTQCGLRLPEEAIALRQIAVLARFEQQKPVLHLWDLRTGMPFMTEDQSPSGALVADGPFYASVGAYALWFVPVGVPSAFIPAGRDTGTASGAEAAWRALPARTFLDRRAPAPPQAPVPPAIPREALNQTSVTLMAAPLLIGEGAEPEVGWGTLRVAGGGRREKRSISAERLEQGLLLGRYERCGVTVDDDNHVSRVHLLLVRIGAEVWALDTASTHGVRRDGRTFQAGALSDADSLVLAGAVRVDWQRSALPEA